MTFEIVQCEDENNSSCEAPERSEKLHRCLEMCVNLKDRKIVVAAQGVFVVSLGLVLLVGHYAIKATTTSTVHTEPSIPTAVNAVLVILSGLFFTSLVFKPQRHLIFTTIILSTVSGVLSAIAAVHYGITVSSRLASLSDCTYVVHRRLCICSVVTSSLRVTYDFRNTVSCTIITNHLREVAYGMCGVYIVTFLCCFGAAVYAILLAHKLEIRKIKSVEEQESVTTDSICKEKQPLEEHSADILPEDIKKTALPSQHDIATQTAPRSTKNDANYRHQCRHFVEVTVPDTNDDFVVNITKSRDPPPPYCETAYN